jgi:hypothetical protein
MARDDIDATQTRSPNWRDARLARLRTASLDEVLCITAV